MPEEPTMEVEARGAFRIVSIHGRLGMTQSEPLIDVLHELAANPDCGAIALNLSNVDYIGSRALGLFSVIDNEMKARGRRFLITDPSPEVREILRVTHQDRVIEIVQDLDALLHRSEDLIESFGEALESEPPPPKEEKPWDRF